MATKTNFEQLKRLESDVELCTKCGYCTFWCPIYQEEPLESSVARGKFVMLKAVLAGEQEYTEEFADSIGAEGFAADCVSAVDEAKRLTAL